jgi:hypothetical protein
MDRIDEHLESGLIDLGAASVETRGIPHLVGELDGGHAGGGLADE